MRADIRKTLPLITLAFIFTLTIGSVTAADTGSDTTCISDQNCNPCCNDNQDLDQNNCDQNCPCCNETNCTDNSTDNGNNPAAAGGKETTINDPSTVNASAATDTIPLQKTGIPVGPLALAMISIFGGLIAPKLK
jgi:hypothetical protein